MVLMMGMVAGLTLGLAISFLPGFIGWIILYFALGMIRDFHRMEWSDGGTKEAPPESSE